MCGSSIFQFCNKEISSWFPKLFLVKGRSILHNLYSTLISSLLVFCVSLFSWQYMLSIFTSHRVWQFVPRDKKRRIFCTCHSPYPCNDIHSAEESAIMKINKSKKSFLQFRFCPHISALNRFWTKTTKSTIYKGLL